MWQGPAGPFGSSWTEATLPVVSCNQTEDFAEQEHALPYLFELLYIACNNLSSY